ncbi:hypothetical protein [Pseudomonas sp. KCJK9000]|uniref:hypothetical protein n=1 Tax=Pseudomonas sp. KCJK9000 TaxID=3344566 RepID=UPI003906C71B
MTRNNIERFDEAAALILTTLYSHFPEPIYLDPNVIGLSREEPQINSQGQDFYSSDWYELDEFIRNSARWLAEEGYLSQRGETISSRYTLSAVGLRALKHVDQPEIGSETLGEKLEKAASETAKATTSMLLDQFLTIGMNVVTKSMGI